jgi:uncharacterized alkaline shock family protein YloU
MSERYVLHENGGAIAIGAGVLEQLVQQAAEAVDGVRVRRGRRGVELRVAAGRVRVELDLAARYGAVLPEAAGDVQQRVADALAGMCGLAIDAVDVAIEELDGA